VSEYVTEENLEQASPEDIAAEIDRRAAEGNAEPDYAPEVEAPPASDEPPRS
jgi:hypothetical protein